MKRYIIDASVALAFLLPDEIYREKTQKLFTDYADGKISFLAPLLLYYEVSNGLKSARLRKRLSFAQAETLLKSFLKLEIPTSADKNMFPHILKLADKYNLSAYDAAYLALAKKEKCKLLTTDNRLFNILKNKFRAIKLLKEQ